MLFSSTCRVGKLGEMRPPLIVHAVHTVLVICIKGEVQNVTIFATKFCSSSNMQYTFQGSTLKWKAQGKTSFMEAYAHTAEPSSLEGQPFRQPPVISGRAGWCVWLWLSPETFSHCYPSGLTKTRQHVQLLVARKPTADWSSQFSLFLTLSSGNDNLIVDIFMYSSISKGVQRKNSYKMNNSYRFYAFQFLHVIFW